MGWPQVGDFGWPPGGGLIYLRNRYYDPGSGQVTQQDPIGLAGGLNVYGYAGGDPVNSRDPFGLCNQAKGEVEFNGSCFSAPAALATAASALFATAEGLGKAIAGVFRAGEATVAEEGIYEFPAASGRTYVGQSGSISTRIGQHLRSGKLVASDATQVARTEVLGGKTAREVAEQMRINDLGGIENLENKVNPIGKRRESLLPRPPEP